MTAATGDRSPAITVDRLTKRYGDRPVVEGLSFSIPMCVVTGFLDRTPRRGGQWRDHRQVINGVLWRTRTGAPWRDLPACYGKWQTVYYRHRRWSADGTWERVLDGLRVGCDAD